ncbi:MAG: hypothetical protein HY273_15330, partial [Gammaproteobacteria bacterium]|nr:hypothetical protein [Gammaproteobacteria bacterium]
PVRGTSFDVGSQSWQTSAGSARLTDVSADKVKSDAPELWLRLVRAPKLIDVMRAAWGFRGILVKFKLEVGVSQKQLLDIAEKSGLPFEKLAAGVRMLEAVDLLRSAQP